MHDCKLKLVSLNILHWFGLKQNKYNLKNGTSHYRCHTINEIVASSIKAFIHSRIMHLVFNSPMLIIDECKLLNLKFIYIFGLNKLKI